MTTETKDTANTPDVGIAPAIEKLIQTMVDDPEYAWGWQANIAMAQVDVGVDHQTANRGAANFLRVLSANRVKMDEHEYYKDLEKQWATPNGKIDIATAYRDVSINHIYVSVRGFTPGSGAVSTALDLQKVLEGQGFQTTLSYPEEPGVEKDKPNKEKTLVTITAHSGAETNQPTDTPA